MTTHSNVVALPEHFISTVEGEPVERIVELLEEALAEARQGTLRGLGLAKVLNDGTSTPLMCSSWHSGGGRAAMCYAVSRLAYLVNKENYE